MQQLIQVNMNPYDDIILASASPRRQDLLKSIGLDFRVHVSEFEEKSDELPAEEIALHNAIGKAHDVAKHYKNTLIIAADTVVSFQDHILGKPKDDEHAKEMLRLLSNTTHQVITAICIIDANRMQPVTSVTKTNVTIDRLDEHDIDLYVRSGEGHDKAAGYAIQGLGGLFVQNIEGDYFNVVGLPIYTLRKMLEKFKVKYFYGQ